MNKIPNYQRRRMGVGLVITGVALLVTVGVLVAGTRLILNSSDGERIENRALEGPVRFLPESSTALIGVVDESRRLTSVAVLGLSPTGSGGAIMPMSASADIGSDQAEVLRPLAATVADSENGAENFLRGVESISNIDFDRVELLDAARFEQLFGSVGEIDVNLSGPITDTDSGQTWDAGEQRLTIAEAARLLTATSVYAQDWYHDAARYSVWRGIALSTGGQAESDPPPAATTLAPTSTLAGADPAAATTAAPAPAQALDVPSNMDEFVQRLLSGRVVQRGLGITAVEEQRVLSELDPALAGVFGTDGVPSVVVHNLSEAAIVGSAVAPGRVGATRDGASYRVVAAFNDEDLAGYDFTRADLVKEAVDRLAFSGVNLPSVVILDEPARPDTVIEVARAEDLEAARTQAIDLELGAQISASVAEEPIVGIDVVVYLGTSYLDFVKGKLTTFDGPFTMELSSDDPLSLSPVATTTTLASRGSAAAQNDNSGDTQADDGDGGDADGSDADGSDGADESSGSDGTVIVDSGGSGDSDSGDDSTGDDSTGDDSTGDDSTGDDSTGDDSTGDDSGTDGG